MSITITVMLATHVYLALAAAVFYYLILLDLVRHYPVSALGIRTKSMIASTTSILTWVSGSYFLGDYFLGRSGFLTDVGVTKLIPFFMIAQQIILPLIAIIGISIFFIIIKKDIKNTEHNKLWKRIFFLSATGCMSGATLMFLGILVP